MKTIYLTGHNNFNNRGCEAIVRSTIKLLRENNKSTKFIVPSVNIEKDLAKWPDAKKHGVIFVKYQVPFILKILWKLQKVFNLTRYEILNYYPQTLLKICESVDLFLSVGGDNYSFDYTFPAHIIYQDKLAFKMKKPVVLWGASVGKFDSMPSLVPKLKNHLSKMKVIYVRENISYLYLKEILKLKNVKYSCDPAFSLNIESSDKVDYLLKSINTKNIIGINLSRLILQRKDKKVNIKKEIKKLVFEINKKYKMHVVFVPHVWDELKNYSNDDYQLLKKIFKACVRENLNVSLAPIEINACQIKYLLSHFKIFIGARMHSTIAALSSNIPTISISYSIKSKGINEMIFENQKLVVNCNGISKFNLIKKIDFILKNQEYLEKNLKTKNKYISNLLNASSKDLYTQIP